MNWFEGKKLVVPIDFSGESRRAVDEALDMVFHPEEVQVIHVAPHLASVAPEVVWQEISSDVREQDIEKHFQREFDDDKYRHVPFHVAFGDPGEQIVEFAESTGADVIVMPSHGRTGLSRLLLGSVAERVVRLAHCPVLILRS